MIARFAVAALALGSVWGVGSVPAMAASFDCAKAATPMETTICAVPALSGADEVLAKSFATALGGLTKPSEQKMRADQRAWLDFAERSCTDNAKPMTIHSDDPAAGACLVAQFKTRSTRLEQSRMLGGHRFLIQSVYGVLPDPDEVGNPDSNWKVATHELVVPRLDSDDKLAEGFNGFVTAEAKAFSTLGVGLSGQALPELEGTANTEVTIKPVEVVESRISLEVFNYWFGHGAAHGNWGISYLHYLTNEGRGLEASDLFAGDDWQDVLVEAAWAQLHAEHDADWLQVDDKSEIAETVVDPHAWSFERDQGLTIQFDPYEVAAYAYGAPTITIPWDKLEAIKADGQDSVRYGW